MERLSLKQRPGYEADCCPTQAVTDWRHSAAVFYYLDKQEPFPVCVCVCLTKVSGDLQ